MRHPRAGKSAWMRHGIRTIGTTWVAAGPGLPEQQAPEQQQVPRGHPAWEWRLVRPPSAGLPVRLASPEPRARPEQFQARVFQAQVSQAQERQLQALQASQASAQLRRRAAAVPGASHPFRAAPAVRADQRHPPARRQKSSQTWAESPDDPGHGPACRGFHRPVARE